MILNENVLSIRLNHLYVDSCATRRFFQKNGIKWTRSINPETNVDLSQPQDKLLDIPLTKPNKSRTYFLIEVLTFLTLTVNEVFPDEDFCLYNDFPFEQLVIVSFYMDNLQLENIKNNKTKISCTYAWLARYHSVVSYFLKKDEPNWPSIAIHHTCDFRRMLNRCAKSSFVRPQVRKYNTIKELKASFEIILLILFYFASFGGIITNMIVIIVILSKKNAENFGDLKQYSYLVWNSVFNVAILTIQLMSWFAECSPPNDFLCLDTRKYVASQFFKVIFKEFLVATLKFMTSFAYIGFSLNRLALIGSEQSKLVKFASETSVKLFIFVSLARFFRS